jgi:hypothetical protein
VQIKTLGDFTVNYRIAGVLEDLKTYIASHSQLKRNVLDQLHENNIEIMSPAFIGTRVLNQKEQIIPTKPLQHETSDAKAVSPDNIIFDKAERAELHDDFRKRLADVREKIKLLEQEIADLPQEEDSATLLLKKTKMEARAEQLVKYINKLEDRMSEA